MAKIVACDAAPAVSITTRSWDVKLGDQRHELCLVYLVADRDRAFGDGRDPVRQRMVKIGVDRRGLEAGKRRTAEDQARQRCLARPALCGRNGNDAHPMEPRSITTRHESPPADCVQWLSQIDALVQ
jgi:hypothetical protein